MNIQKRLQIEFEFLGDEQISANTALKIINDIFKEAESEQLTIGDVSQCFAIKEPIILDAMTACFDVGYASTSLFTRRLNIPYKTAMKIMDTLETNKFVESFNGIAQRNLLLNNAEFKQILKQNCG